MPESHDEATERSFTQQALGFEDARFNRVLTTESEWVFAALPRTAEDVVLDVAAGTGQAARSLAPEVRAVVAIDATEAMLAVGRAQADREGLSNIVFQRGDAARLPFLDASFSIVVCRYAVHHFAEPDAQLAEMARCVRPGGRLALADLVSVADGEVAARQNRLERLRDGSHVRALSTRELAAAIARHGLTVESVETREVRRPLESWLEQTQTPAAAAAEIERALEDELAGGARTGFQPARGDDGLTFVQRYTSIVATR